MTYASEVLADSPLAYYRLGEASGTTMVDSSGNGRNGAYGTGAVLAAGSLLASDTDTSVDCITGGTTPGRVPSAAWMDQAQFTIEAWINLDTAASDRTIVSRYEGYTATELMFTFRVDGSNLIFWRGVGGSFVNVSTAGISPGTTYHVAASYDGTTARLYANGVLAKSAAQGAHALTTRPLTIGASDVKGERFDGRIDEVAFYGTALSDARIAAHYAAGTAAPVTYLSSVWGWVA